jgi:hypothetical protein
MSLESSNFNLACVQSSKPKSTALKRFSPILCLVLALSSGITPLYAQYEREEDATIPLEHFYIQRKKNGLRNLLSKLYFSFSTGYATTPFRHKLDGFGVVQQPDSMPRIFDHDNAAVRYSNWTNDVVASNSALVPGAFMVNSDTAETGFRSRTFSIPLKASLHVEFDRYRLGGGYSLDYTRIGDFKPISYESNIRAYSLERSNMFVKHYFGMIGAMVYRYYEYSLVVDANIGGYSLGRDFAKNAMKKSIYLNLGVQAEREFSEYFRLFIRPSYEIKSYKLTIPETTQTLQHRLDGFYLNIGFTYRFPELRRCFLKTCHAQINHAHGNREYRSRRHPVYKKQNPRYGENYPELIKYKGKNKKKLNPY